MGGKNFTELIRNLTEINGRKVSDLEKDMRPWSIHPPPDNDLHRFIGSRKGFLGNEEKLLDVLAMDNEFVVDKFGLTHQEMARPLLIAVAMGVDRDTKRFKKEATTFRYHGQNYRISIECYKGSQESPFLDKTGASCDAYLENLTLKKTLKYSLLGPLMIERYGFYEGKGTPYRVEPLEVMEIFPYLKLKENP